MSSILESLLICVVTAIFCSAVIAFGPTALHRWTARACKHPEGMITADVLEGAVEGLEVKWCRQCGAVRVIDARSAEAPAGYCMIRLHRLDTVAWRLIAPRAALSCPAGDGEGVWAAIAMAAIDYYLKQPKVTA